MTFPMECLKTGALAYLDQYGEVVRGDLFQLGNFIILRVCERDIPGDAAHAFITDVFRWFDEDAVLQGAAHYSTIIGKMSQFNYGGL